MTSPTGTPPFLGIVWGRLETARQATAGVNPA
jgi:hypothetical protein